MNGQNIFRNKLPEAFCDNRIGHTLTGIISSADHLQGILKTDINYGDVVFVKTVKSLYRMGSLGGGLYEVSGGWFDKKGYSPAQMRINGCTWGGSAIKIDLIAACGLRIEFGNRLITSPVQKYVVLPNHIKN